MQRPRSTGDWTQQQNACVAIPEAAVTGWGSHRTDCNLKDMGAEAELISSAWRRCPLQPLGRPVFRPASFESSGR